MLGAIGIRNFFQEDQQVIGVEEVEITQGSNERHPLLDQKNIRELIKVAQDLELKYKNHQKLSLGQSPAWLIKTMSLLGSNSDDYKYVPFSGQWNWGELSCNMPSIEQEKAYREYLSSIIGVSPSLISDIYNQQGKPTVLFEVTHHGNGLRCFLEFLDAWRIEDEISDADWTKMFKVQILYHSFGIPMIGFGDYDIENYQVPQKLFVDLANSDRYKDRLVPRCHSRDWNKMSETGFGQEHMDQQIISFFTGEIESVIKSAADNLDDGALEEPSFRSGPCVDQGQGIGCLLC